MNWPADLAEFAALMDRIGFDVGDSRTPKRSLRDRASGGQGIADRYGAGSTGTARLSKPPQL